MADSKFNTYKDPEGSSVTVYKQDGKYDPGAGSDRAVRGLGAVAKAAVMADTKGKSQIKKNFVAGVLRDDAAKDRAKRPGGYGAEYTPRQSKKTDGQNSKGNHKFFHHDIKDNLK